MCGQLEIRSPLGRTYSLVSRFLVPFLFVFWFTFNRRRVTIDSHILKMSAVIASE